MIIVMYKKITILFLLVLLANIANTAYAQQKWQDADYIQRAFNEIALKNEYKETTMQVRKWQSAISYDINFFRMNEFTLATELTKIHLQHLQQITNLSIKQATDNNPNLSIIFTQDKNYKQAIQQFSTTNIKNIERESNCIAQFTTNSKSAIISAVVIIPIDHAMSRGLLLACIVEELTQVMGLPNDSDWVHPTIANDKSKVELLTGLDYIFLKILYAETITPGMYGSQLQNKIQAKITKLQQQKIIEQANILVNKYGLFPFIN